jgi:tRNA pseudouridine32 synthase / 23S rRNA pseudouridine746 synthase
MIPILYDNDDIIAIDKPAGIASIPERDRIKETVLSLLEKQTGKKLFIVHRLDKEVGGVMLFAKTAEAHRYLNEEFFNRNVVKTYLALVFGTVKEDKGEIDRPIRQFGSGRMGVDEKRGKPSLTKYEVVKRLDSRTLIHAFPVTGRRHQIRVHLYHIGHPIVGDQHYGDKNIQKNFPRLMLHAEKIQFKNSSGKEIAVESKLPEIFTMQ